VRVVSPCRDVQPLTPWKALPHGPDVGIRECIPVSLGSSPIMRCRSEDVQASTNHVWGLDELVLTSHS
jgi:hypothetical protein